MILMIGLVFAAPLVVAIWLYGMDREKFGRPGFFKTISEGIKDALGVELGMLFIVGWFGSIPLAFIFGDKIDVVLSFSITMYGLIVMIDHFLR